MYGELTDKETVSRLEFSLESQQQDQFEILLYKKNSKSACVFKVWVGSVFKNICWEFPFSDLLIFLVVLWGGWSNKLWKFLYELLVCLPMANMEIHWNVL